MENLFHSASSSMINSAKIELIECQPSSQWALPSISPSEFYGDLSMFHLKAITRIIVKEGVSQTHENAESIQTISLLDPKKL